MCLFINIRFVYKSELVFVIILSYSANFPTSWSCNRQDVSVFSGCMATTLRRRHQDAGYECVKLTIGAGTENVPNVKKCVIITAVGNLLLGVRYFAT